MVEDIEKIIQDCGAQLYDTESVIENGHKIFRVLIDIKGGVNLEKCEEISKILSPIFDLNPPVAGQYYLEVSSPGIERILRLPKHFKASIGAKVKVKFGEENIEGSLVFADEDSVIVENQNETKKILYSDIKKAKTLFKW